MSTTPVQFCLMLAIAVEMSGATWLVGSCAGAKLRRKALSDETPIERMRSLLAEIETALKKFGGGEHTRVVVAYEAGQEGFWLVRELRARGIEAEVIDPVSLKVDRRGKRAKTDRLDVEALARALYAWMAGDTTALRMVRVPSKEDEDNREWQRERDRLMSERRGCLDRIGKKLRTHGIWVWDRTALEEGTLRCLDGTPLGPMLQETMRMELDRVEKAEAKLAVLNKQVEQLSADAHNRIERLTLFRGIGETGGRGLALKLYWREFDNRRQVGACTGLVSMAYDSGTMRQDQGISKQGDPSLRALLVELSWLWLKHQPTSEITAWFRKRTEGQGKRHKRSMIVAVARRLAIALWRYLKDGVVPEGAVFKKHQVAPAIAVNA